ARVGSSDEVAGADLVVNATSLGLAGSGGGELAFDPQRLGTGQLVVDLNYPDGQMVSAARARGAKATDGVGMLVHQAAHAFRIWTGDPAPLAAMQAAARGALAARAGR
ncbi:MAG: hypothetical protein ACRDZW_02250, partial [Acidimicrobiales bacterium]